MDLSEFVSPPRAPVYAGNPSDWHCIESILEMPLPMDFKILIERYGCGCFGNFLWPFSPFAPFISELNLLSGGTKQILVAYEQGLKEFPEYSPPYSAYPNTPGLFPWGKSTNGDILFWLTLGEPARWPTVVCDSKFSEDYDVFEMTASTFLRKWLNRELMPKAFPGEEMPVLCNFTPLLGK